MDAEPIGLGYLFTTESLVRAAGGGEIEMERQWSRANDSGSC
jgi:hypothetical protein